MCTPAYRVRGSNSDQSRRGPRFDWFTRVQSKPASVSCDGDFDFLGTDRRLSDYPFLILSKGDADITGRSILLAAVLSTTALVPAGALAQTREDCDLLLVEIDGRQGQELPVTREEVAVFMEHGDFAACQQALQQVQALGPAEAQE